MATAEIFCTTVNIGEAPIIMVTTSALEVDRWSLSWYFGSQAGTIRENRTEQNAAVADYVWPLSFYNEIPNATKSTGTLILDLYKRTAGSYQHIGYITKPFEVTVNKASSTPTIFPASVKDQNAATVALTGDNTKLIRFASTATISWRTGARNGATISQVQTDNSGQTAYGESAAITNVESREFYGKVTDSRGYLTSVLYTLPADQWIEYIKPTCNQSNEIPDGNGKMELTCSGNFFNSSFGAVSNTLTAQYRYKLKDGGTFTAWKSMSVTLDGNAYNATAQVTNLDHEAAYVFECRATDKIMTVTSAEITVQAKPVFHWSADDFVFEVPVTAKNDISAQDISANDITAQSLSAEDISGLGILTGSWTPTLTTAAAVQSYTTRSGWYMRIGKMVTVGFNINATCIGNYNTTPIAISGLPFAPAVNAFGGGVMFGAYVNASFCFEAWAAATDGQITPRLQPCNRSSNENLQIASTAYYPFLSGAANKPMTLGGTITYMTDD